MSKIVLLFYLFFVDLTTVDKLEVFYIDLAYRSQSWTDSHALWLERRVLLITRAFSGLGIFTSSLGVFGTKNTNDSTRFWTADLQRKSLQH